MAPPLYFPHLLELEPKLKDSFLGVLHVDGAMPQSPDPPFQLLDTDLYHSFLSILQLFFYSRGND